MSNLEANFLTSMTPMLTVSQFFGLINFSFDGEKINFPLHRYFCTLVSTLIITLDPILYGATGFFYFYNSIPFKLFIMQNFDLIARLLTALAGLIISGIYHRRKLVTIIQHFLEIDILLIHKLDRLKAHSNQKTFCILLLVYSFGILISSFGWFLSTNVYSTFNWGCFRTFSITLTELVNALTTVIFVSVIIALQIRLKVINLTLLQYYRQYESCSSYTIVIIDFNSKVSQRIEETISISCEAVRNLRKVHGRLYEISENLTSCYGLPILGVTLRIFTYSIVAMYFSLCISQTDLIGVNCTSKIQLTAKIIFTVSLMIIMTLTCQLALNENKAIIFNIQRLLLETRCPRETEEELKRMCRQMTTLKLEFSICGFFTLNMQFLVLTVLSGFSCGHVLTSHVCDTNIDNIGDSPEFICGSDLKIYPNLREFHIARCFNNIDLLEMPLSMCYPQPQGEPESLTYEIGLSMLSIPQNPQQKTWIQNLNQRNIRHPISNRLRENPYLNRRLPAHYYGRNLRGSLRNSIFPSNYDRHGIRAPNSAHVYQDKGLPRAGQQYQDKRFQNPMRHHHSQFKPPLHPPKDHKKHNFMRPYIHPRFLENALNLMPFPTQLPIVDQFDNFQNLVPSGATETCDDELTPDDSVPELKKTGRKVPDATKPAKPKGGKPASKAKAPKKPSKGNQGKHLNEESKKAEEGSPEALRQAVEERSGLKVFQNLSKNVTKNTDSDDKKGVSSKSDDEIKSDDKNEPSKGTDEKPGSSVDQNSKKESDQDQEQDAAADAKSDDSRSVSTDEKKNDGAATER